MAVEQGDPWRSAPALMQQMRRFHMEPLAGWRARRALFGPIDRDETRRFVKEELAAIRSADQDKYNFDFESMTPLSGPFEWEPVCGGEVSAAYDMCRLRSGLQHRSARRLDFDAAPRPTTPEPEQQRHTVHPETQRRPQRAAASEAQPSETSTSPEIPPLESSTRSGDDSKNLRRQSPPQTVGPAPLALRQTAMTDFWRSRKRPSALPADGDRSTKRTATTTTGNTITSVTQMTSPVTSAPPEDNST